MRQFLNDDLVADLDLDPNNLGKDGKTKSDQWCYDRQQIGLAVRMRAGAEGTQKFWYHVYRLGGVKRHDKLRRLCDLTLNEARAEVQQRCRDMAEFKDPRAERQEKKAKVEAMANTPAFAKAVEEFLADYRGSVRPRTGKLARPSTVKNLEGWLTGPANPAIDGPAYCEPLQRQRVDLITGRNIADLITSLEKTRSRQVSQSVRSSLQSFFSWAMGRKYIVNGVNPVKGVKCPAPPRHSKRKKRPLSVEEIVKVWNAAEAFGEYGKLTRLAILMGVRRQEIGAMRWPELDLDAGVWVIPEDRTKTHQAYPTPLAPAVVKILRSIERKDGRDLVFGARSDKGFSAFSHQKRKLDEAAGIAPWRFHDLRSTIVTRMGKDLRILPHVRATVLNHAGERNITTEFYDDTDYAPEKREALEKWADYVLGLVDGKVVPIRKEAA